MKSIVTIEVPYHKVNLTNLMKKIHYQLFLSNNEFVSGIYIDDYSPILPICYLYKLQPNRAYKAKVLSGDIKLPSFTNLSSVLPSTILIPWREIIACSQEKDKRQIGRLMVDALRSELCFFRIEANKEQKQIISRTMKAAKIFFDKGFSDKKGCKVVSPLPVEAHKMVGYDKQLNCEYFQVRKGLPLQICFSQTEELSSDFPLALYEAYRSQEEIARTCLEFILLGMGMDTEQVTRFTDLTDVAGIETTDGLVEGGLGANILKVSKTFTPCECGYQRNLLKGSHYFSEQEISAAEVKKNNTTSDDKQKEKISDNDGVDKENIKDDSKVNGDKSSSESENKESLKACVCKVPGMAYASTQLHADMGIISVVPIASSPGLKLLSQDATTWLDAESGTTPEYFNIFLGETFARALRLDQLGLKAPLHYIYETPGIERYAMPFYLRGRPNAVIGQPYFRNFNKLSKQDLNEKVDTETVENFVENTLTTRPWLLDGRLHYKTSGVVKFDY